MLLVYKNLISNIKSLSFFVLIISLCYSVFANYPHNWGDPFIYLQSGNNYDFTLLRSPGYPIFLKLFSINFNFIYLTTIFQIIFFLITAVILENEINKFHNKSYLIFLFLAFPDITYLQTLMFPDGLILSFMCLYFVFMIKKKFNYLLLISFILFLLKSYLVFLIIFSIIIYLEKKYLFFNKYKFKYFFTIIFPIIFYVILPINLVQPFYTKFKNENLIIDFKKKCNQEIIILSREDILDGFLNKNHINLSGNIITKNIDNDCKKSFENSFSRSIINSIIFNNYKEVSFNIGKNFISSFSGTGVQDHITSMINHNLIMKIDLIKSNKIEILDYPLYKKVLKDDIHISLLNTNTLPDKFNLLHIFINKFQYVISIIITFLMLFYFFKNKNVKILQNLFAINLNFAIMHSIFPIVLADRHVFYIIILNTLIILLSNSSEKTNDQIFKFKK